jgi:hypothetical protein
MESQNFESSMLAIGEISALALNHFFVPARNARFMGSFRRSAAGYGRQRIPVLYARLATSTRTNGFRRHGSRTGNGPIEPVSQSGTIVPSQAHLIDHPQGRSADTSARRDDRGTKSCGFRNEPWMRAYQDTFAFLRLIDLDSMRDRFHVIRDLKRLDDLNDASGAPARPESRLLLRND